MKVCPIKRIAAPRYPTLTEIEEKQDLFKVLPRRWLGNALVKAGIAACGPLLMAQNTDSTPLARLAPIFQHGGGHARAVYATAGGTGPVFLAEDEARQVILESLERAGLKMVADRPVLEPLKIPGQDPGKHPFAMDGEDVVHHVAYEFLSPVDCKALGMDCTSDVGLGSLLQAADRVQEALATVHTPDRLALFYDPCVHLKYYTEAFAVEGMEPAVFSDNTLAPISMLGKLQSFFRGLPNTASLTIQGDVITLVRGTRRVELTVGSDQALCNGRSERLPCAVSRIGSTPYMPLRAVLEALGYGVVSERDSQGVSISFNDNDPNARAGGFVYQYEGFGSIKPSTFAFLNTDPQGLQVLAKERAKAELRLQVRDFLAWLKAEGVI